MIFLTEKRGRPAGQKNRRWEDISPIVEFTKEEQRLLDISSIFAQKGFFDFSQGAVDNEAIMDTKDQELISLYNELVSIYKEMGGIPQKVLVKLYDTFSNREELLKAVQFLAYVQTKGYSGNTVDDFDIPKDEVSKLRKDFESQPMPTSSSDERDQWGRKKYTHKTPEQKKQDVINLTTKYLKDQLKLDDNEIKSRIDLLFGPVGGKEEPNNTDEPKSLDNYWSGTSTTLQEQILRDFKRFI